MCVTLTRHVARHVGLAPPGTHGVDGDCSTAKSIREKHKRRDQDQWTNKHTRMTRAKPHQRACVRGGPVLLTSVGCVSAEDAREGDDGNLGQAVDARRPAVGDGTSGQTRAAVRRDQTVKLGWEKITQAGSGSTSVEPSTALASGPSPARPRPRCASRRPPPRR